MKGTVGANNKKKHVNPKQFNTIKEKSVKMRHRRQLRLMKRYSEGDAKSEEFNIWKDKQRLRKT